MFAKRFGSEIQMPDLLSPQLWWLYRYSAMWPNEKNMKRLFSALHLLVGAVFCQLETKGPKLEEYSDEAVDLFNQMAMKFKGTILHLPSSADAVFTAHLPSPDSIFANEDSGRPYLSTEGGRRVSMMHCPVSILTAGHVKGGVYETLRSNRLQYAAKHDLCYIHFQLKDIADDDLAFDTLSKIPMHFHRYFGLWRLMTYHLRQPADSWILYQDLDTCFTNSTINPLDFIKKMIEEKDSLLDRGNNLVTVWNPTDIPHVVLATDSQCDHPWYPLNTGVFFIRGSKFGRQFARTVVEGMNVRQAPLFASNNLNDQTVLTIIVNYMYGYILQKLTEDCKEYKNATEIPGTPETHLLDSGAHGNILIAHNRAFNSFKRQDDNDPQVTLWHKGDWIAHLTGMDAEGRAEEYRTLGIV